MRQCNSPGSSGEIPCRDACRSGVVLRMASKNSVRSARRGTTSPPTARASSRATRSRRAQMATLAPARASAKAAARADPPAPKIRTRLPARRSFFCSDAQHADVVRIAARKRAIAAHDHRVYRADVRRQRIAFFQVPQDGLLVRDGDAKAANAELGHGLQKITQIAHQEGQIDSVHSARDKPGIVQQRRQGMPNRIGDHAEHLRARVSSCARYRYFSS